MFPESNIELNISIELIMIHQCVSSAVWMYTGRVFLKLAIEAPPEGHNINATMFSGCE